MTQVPYIPGHLNCSCHLTPQQLQFNCRALSCPSPKPSHFSMFNFRPDKVPIVSIFKAEQNSFLLVRDSKEQNAIIAYCVIFILFFLRISRESLEVKYYIFLISIAKLLTQSTKIQSGYRTTLSYSFWDFKLVRYITIIFDTCLWFVIDSFDQP